MMLRAMIEAETTDGKAVLINPAHIRAIYPAKEGTRVEFADGAPLVLKLRVEAVASRVDRWLAVYLPGERY